MTAGACAGDDSKSSDSQSSASNNSDMLPTPDYSGDLFSRSTMTGDWDELRNDLAKKGITFDLGVTQTYQGVVDGGQQRSARLNLPLPGSDDRTWEYNGAGDFLFNLDTQKFGLWLGGFFTLEVEGDWGSSVKVNAQTGALIPANMNSIYLVPTGHGIAVSNVSYVQFVSTHLGFFVGKIATITKTSGDMNDFAHGKGEFNFMDLAFNFNPAALLIPYSTLGAGVIILPGKSPDDAVISLTVFDPVGQPNTPGFDTLGQDGAMFAGEARIKTNFFGYTGHQLLGGMYSSKTYTSLDQDLRIDIESRQFQRTSGAWVVYYNFDQYLYQTKDQAGKDQGWGVFGRFGISDGNPNPLHYFWSVGLGGKGIIPPRPNDSFGVGYYYITTSNANVARVVGLNDEQGMEVFYNIAITPWCHLTPDMQYIDGARANAEPAWVMGVRLKTDL
jgi:porin